MTSEAFRRQLRREAETWQKQGWITAEQFEQLADYYQFNRLEVGVRDRFVLVLVSLGSLLLGIGAITFVAANWQAISREGKLALLFTLFLGVNILGYQLWRRPPFTLPVVEPAANDPHSPPTAGQRSHPYRRERWQNRLGHALLLLGALLLGANIALTGQLFHISGSAYDLCFAWGIGVLAMAYGLRLTSLGMMAIALVGLGYWLSIQDMSMMGVPSSLARVLEYMPLLAGAAFLPLAYICRSRVIFAGMAIAVLSSFAVVMADLTRLFPNGSGLLLAIALVLPPALLWSYDDSPWRRLLHRPAVSAQPFRSTAQGLALVWLVLLLGTLAFHWVWPLQPERPSLSQQVSHLFTTGLPLLLNPNVLVLTLLTLIGWVHLAYSQRRHRWSLIAADVIVLLFLGLTALVIIWHWSIFPIQWVATYIMNLLFFLLAVGFLRQGLGQGNRPLFWCGLVMATLQILSRTLEYDTGLLLKSLIFILCGIGVMLIGLWFERYVRTLTPPQDSSSLPS